MNFGRTWSALTVFAAACLAGVPSSALAESAASQEDFAKWCTNAIRGDASSQYNLALCYQKGLYVAANAETAAEWLQKAAKQDFVPAQIELASCCDSGRGVPADRSEAAAWLLRVAEKGFARAQFLYAVRCMKGDGVPEDKAKAVSWFEKAARQEMAPAHYLLGEMYFEGSGVAESKPEAVRRFRIAAEKGCVPAQRRYGECLFTGTGVGKDATEAAKWFRRAQSSGDVEAGYRLGVCLRDGKGADRDEAAAFSLFKKSAEAGVPAAQFALSLCYATGTGVAANVAESEKWLESAANAGDADAKNLLARNTARRETEARAKAERLAAEKRRLARLEAERVAAEKRARESAAAIAALNVDRDIPENPKNSRPIFVCVVANEDYSSCGTANVVYAKNDGETFAAYAKKTLGVPERNVRVFTNATAGTMHRAEMWLERCANLYPNSEIIFYYAGHGVPVIENGRVAKQCLLPTDVPAELSSALGIDLKKFFERLGKIKATRVSVFLDACFSGMTREDLPQMAARGARIEATTTEAQGNMVVFSAASGDQTALPLAGKKHGLFTYCLLKKLQETRGHVSCRELGEHLKLRVPQLAYENDLNGTQTPTMRVSGDFDLDRKLVD